MPGRSFTAGRFALFVDGEAMGFVKSVSGGNIKGEVAAQNAGPDNVVKKHIARVTYEPITLESGFGMTQGFYDWIRASFDKSHATKSGEIVAADFDYKARRATEFTDALISEVTIPALDASSKEAAHLSVTITPERLRREKRGGEQLSSDGDVATKKWLASNFRFELGDLPCERVSKIDSFTIKQTVVEDQVGRSRLPKKHPAKLEVPNLKVTFSAADQDAWEDWFQSFVIEGKCADSDELTGAIRFLGPDLKEELGRVDLHHVGIISLEPEKVEANKEQAARLEAELYVEAMSFGFKGAGA